MGLGNAMDESAPGPSDPGLSGGNRLADEFPALLWAADDKGSCVYVNNEWLGFTGRALQDELGDGWMDALHPDDRPVCSAAYHVAVEKRDEFDQTYRLRRHDGIYRWIRHRARPHVDGGRLAGYLGTGIDVTEQVESQRGLRAHRNSLRLALDAAGMGASVWYSETGEVEWDETTESLFGLSPGTFDGTFDGWMTLVHPDDVEIVKHSLAEALDHHGTYHLEHRVQLPDGGVRWLERRGETFFDESGRPAGTRGVTMDVTERHVAAEAPERQRARLAVQAEAGGLLGQSLHIDETIHGLGGAIVPSFADGFVFDLIDGGRVRRFTVEADHHGVTTANAVELDGVPEPSRRHALKTGRLRLDRSASSAGSTRGAMVQAPIVVRGRTIGVVSVRWRTEPVDLHDRVDVVTDLAARAGLALDNARLFEAQRSTLIELQQSLLPEELSVPPGYDLAVRYQPGAIGSEVGGDWYDADAEPSGVTHMSVGDVVGKGTRAASVMVRAHTALRTLLREQPPAAAMEQLSRQPSIASAGYLTVLAATLQPDGTTVFCNAGHPPPFLALPDGGVERLDIPPSPPLGFGCERTFTETTYKLPAGARLVMYTDGLIERRGEAIDDGFDRLARVLQAGRGDRLDELADRVLADLHVEQGDDAALLVVEVGRH